MEERRIYIKKISEEDKDNEILFDFITNMPENENGFRNPWYYFARDYSFSEWIDIMLKIDKGECKIENEAIKHSFYWVYCNETPVGIGKIRELTEEEKKVYGHIGYYIAKQYRGQGFATAAVKLLISEAKENKKIEEVILSIRVGNLESIRIAEKCGAELRYIVDDKFCKYYC